MDFFTLWKLSKDLFASVNCGSQRTHTWGNCEIHVTCSTWMTLLFPSFYFISITNGTIVQPNLTTFTQCLGKKVTFH
jgi:hypothetical protein